MKTSPLLLLPIILLWPFAARAESPSSCAEFNALAKRIYNFDPDKLTDAQTKAKEKQLDHFWDIVKANKAKYLPCLRARVADPKGRPFLRYDGVNLLVELAPSLDSKRLQVEVYTNSPLDFIEEGRWVSVLTQRGIEGFDVSKAAKRALDDTHMFDDESISNFEAAEFLWESQTEERSTPQLFLLANNLDYRSRESALAILLDQATPQARDLVLMLDQTDLSDDAVASIREFLRSPGDVVPRHKAKITRPRFLRAFNDLLKGDSDRFDELIDAVPDCERDAATVLHPSDLPLLHRVRRLLLRETTDYSLEYYDTFTGIIFAIMKKDARIPKV